MHLLSGEFQPFCSGPNKFKVMAFLCRTATHWGRVTHICVSKPNIFGSDNGLSPVRCQTIIWTNADLLLVVPLETNFSEISIKLLNFHSRNAFENVVCEAVSTLSRPQWVNYVSVDPGHLFKCGSSPILMPARVKQIPKTKTFNLFKYISHWYNQRWAVFLRCVPFYPIFKLGKQVSVWRIPTILLFIKMCTI